MANGEENGNGKRRWSLTTDTLLPISVVASLIGFAAGGAWWLAALKSDIQANQFATNAAILNLNIEMKKGFAALQVAVIDERRARYFDEKNQWERFHLLNRDLVIPELQHMPVPGPKLPTDEDR